MRLDGLMSRVNAGRKQKKGGRKREVRKQSRERTREQGRAEITARWRKKGEIRENSGWTD